MDSYPNIDSRDSPGGSCSILDETDTRLNYKKSLFRSRKSQSQSNMVRPKKTMLHCQTKGRKGQRKGLNLE